MSERKPMILVLAYAKLENPWYWTIDREKKSYLFGVYYLRDFFNETVFVFIWNNKHYTVQFLSRYDEDDTLIWDVPENYACKSFVFPYNTEEGFIDDLRSALIAYVLLSTLCAPIFRNFNQIK